MREAGRGRVFVDELVDEKLGIPTFLYVLSEACEVAPDRAEANNRLGTAAKADESGCRHVGEHLLAIGASAW